MIGIDQDCQVACFTSVSPVFQQCFTSVSPMFHECFASVSPVFFQCFYKDFTSVLPVFRQCFISVSQVFHQCFTGVVSQLPKHMEGSFVLISAHIYAFVCVCLTCHK